MSIQANKSEVISQFKLHKTDTGSVEVQVSLLTNRISQLTEHLKTHKKDLSSRKGLVHIVNQRRSLLDYLKNTYYDRYLNLIKALKLRH